MGDPISINSDYEMYFDQQAPELRSISCVSMLHGMRGRVFKPPFQRMLRIRRKLKIETMSSTIDDDTKLSGRPDQHDDLKLRYLPFGSVEIVYPSKSKKRKPRT